MSITIILVVVTLISIIYAFLISRDIKKIINKLSWVKKENTNTIITTETFHPNITKLIIEINDVLEKGRLLESKTIETKKEMKQMISNISHDLRTPLTSLIGYLQLIQTDHVTAEKKAEYLKIIETRLQDLSEMMNDFFDFNKFIEDQVSLSIEKINISNLLEDSFSLYFDDFSNKGMQANLTIKEDIYCHTDLKLLKRVFQNIFSNALRHGQERVDISLEKKDKIEITFKNNIDSTQNIETDRLFDRFYTVDTSRTSKHTGLGLAIVKEIITELKGSICAELFENVLAIKITLPF